MNDQNEGQTDKPESKELDAATILAAQDRVIERVEVPEWGGHVFVKSMSGIEKERYVESVRKTIGKGRNATETIVVMESSAKLAQQTICDKHGKLLFTPAQIKTLAAKSAKALQRVVDVSSRLNGLDEDSADDSKNALAGETANDDSNTD